MGNGQWAIQLRWQWAMGNSLRGNGQWAIPFGAMGNGQGQINIFIFDKKKNMAEYTFQETNIYKKAFMQAMEIFEISKSFPKEETYSLTDQIRRSSRSVCANYAEAHRKRRYPAHFISKLTDCDAENSETLVWLDFALACKYINEEKYQYHFTLNSEIGKFLGHALMNPDKY